MWMQDTVVTDIQHACNNWVLYVNSFLAIVVFKYLGVSSMIITFPVPQRRITLEAMLRESESTFWAYVGVVGGGPNCIYIDSIALA